MHIAVYGGSFNPPHVSHGLVVAWLLWTEQVQEVWLLPTFSHPFSKDLAPFARRVRLCEILAGVVGDGVQVCTVESELPSPSYTIDTLTVLAARHPEHHFRLVVGSDVLDDLPKWKQWDAIAARFAPIVVGRQGYPVPEGAVGFPGVSSTEIRRRIAEGESVDHLVPAAVRAELGDLYKSGPKPMKP